MSKARSGSRPRDKGSKAGTGNWKQFVSAGALVVAVTGTLILAAVLRTGPDPLSPSAEPVPRIDASPEEEVRHPERAAGDPLLLRAGRDRDRLTSRTAVWTLQFARLCERDHAERILTVLASRDDLYLIERNGCYLVCWGLYASADLARTGGDVPSALAELPDRPFPKRVEETLR